MKSSCKKVLFKKNFKQQSFNIPTDFVYFQVPGYIADDATATQNPVDGLVIENPSFAKRSVGIVDHTKYLVLTNKTFNAPSCGEEIYVKAKMNFKALNIVLNNQLAPGLQKYADGIQNIQDDPRVSCCALNLLDLSTGMVFDFIFSNQTVYALYEHLPISQDTAVFTHAISVMSRPADLDTLHKFKIGYNKLKKQVIWYINGNVVYTINIPGLMLTDKSSIVTFGGGEEKAVNIKSVKGGFGLFTLLDFFPFANSYEQIGQSYTISNGNLSLVEPLANLGSPYYKRMLDQLGNPVPQTDFIYNGPNNQVDGQGGKLTVTTFEIGIQ